MFRSRLIPLAAVLAVVGCKSGGDVLRLDTTPRPETHPDSVRLIAEEPRQPYTVIALVAVTRGDGFLFIGRKPARTRLLEAAARLGGDAVLLGTGSLTRVTTGGGEYSGSTLQLSGKVIVFSREPRATNSQ
jgi:hypothetical protein